MGPTSKGREEREEEIKGGEGLCHVGGRPWTSYPHKAPPLTKWDGFESCIMHIVWGTFPPPYQHCPQTSLQQQKHMRFAYTLLSHLCAYFAVILYTMLRVIITQVIISLSALALSYQQAAVSVNEVKHVIASYFSQLFILAVNCDNDWMHVTFASVSGRASGMYRISCKGQYANPHNYLDQWGR